MPRLGVIAAVGLGCLLAAFGPGCAGDVGVRNASQPALTPARINHVVFFKLKDPDEAAALVAESREALGTIPGVICLFAGQHADSGRPTVETGYDACVYVGFASMEDYAAYVSHPNHTGLVGRWKDRFEWYKVYDVRDETFRDSGR